MVMQGIDGLNLECIKISRNLEKHGNTKIWLYFVKSFLLLATKCMTHVYYCAATCVF